MNKRLITLCLVVLFSTFLVSDVKANQSKFIKEDLSSYFTGYIATFFLYDEENDTYIIYNMEQSEKRLTPCSTFKIYNSLVGLETGVITDEETVFKWDGKKQYLNSWEKDQTLKEAIANSTVWYYKELAYKVGQRGLQSYYEKLGYGNNDFTDTSIFNDPKGNAFWLDSSLKISAKEQVLLLESMYNYRLAFSKKNIDIVKKIMVLEENDKYILSGKTGSNIIDDKNVLGWFVGSVEKDGKMYYFAVNIEAVNYATGVIAKKKALEILKDKGLLD